MQQAEVVKEMVTASHGNLNRVRELVEARPALAKAPRDCGFGDWEAAIGAASHVGNAKSRSFLMGVMNSERRRSGRISLLTRRTARRITVRMLRLVFLPAVFAVLALSQTPRFDVVSIKPSTGGAGFSGENTEHGRLTVSNDTVKELIQLAFGVKDFQIIGGPGWLGTATYDIVATTGTADDLTDERLAPLLQSLLEDRLGLKFHRETKESTVYSLVVAKGGPKMTLDTSEGESSSHTNSKSGRTTMVVSKVTAAKLAFRLERYVGRRVIDHTGLTAAYDFTLTWSQDQSADPTGPSIFTALQEQLGLKLDSAKGKVDMIVIDGVEKPSAN